MPKIRKSCTIVIRMIPEEKRAATELADYLGINITDVMRLSLREILSKGSIPFVDFQKTINQPMGNDK
jgi:antitoxin component of RelBE/YafQ-DinJ toxin-antitoxin module